MFKSPFSFNGRIRRLEYGLSWIIYFGVVSLVSVLFGEFLSEQVGLLLFYIVFIPIVWFIWAQGAKRCHDIGRSGWWQLVPLFALMLIFIEGHRERNEYGSNPKYPEQFDMLESETLDGHLRG
jgi:uncharacterized membrane protein YhaH (DUF805 family)